ncbi:hypothetical protein HanIR_Chr14g0722841 [Helianthus annuus]|nr:hypothetical protein HanIR_Chr14g0722841 [Helianthus annuus]
MVRKWHKYFLMHRTSLNILFKDLDCIVSISFCNHNLHISLFATFYLMGKQMLAG